MIVFKLRCLILKLTYGVKVWKKCFSEKKIYKLFKYLIYLCSDVALTEKLNKIAIQYAPIT